MTLDKLQELILTHAPKYSRPDLFPHREALIKDLIKEEILPQDYEDNPKTPVEDLEYLMSHQPNLEDVAHEVQPKNRLLEEARELQKAGLIPEGTKLEQFDITNLFSLINEAERKEIEKQVKIEEGFKDRLKSKEVNEEDLGLMRRAVELFRAVNRGAEQLRDKVQREAYQNVLTTAMQEGLTMEERFDILWDSDMGKALIVGALGRGAVYLAATVPELGTIARVAQTIVETQALSRKINPVEQDLGMITGQTFSVLLTGQEDALPAVKTVIFHIIEQSLQVEIITKMYESSTPLLRHPLQFLSNKLNKQPVAEPAPTPTSTAAAVAPAEGSSSAPVQSATAESLPAPQSGAESIDSSSQSVTTPQTPSVTDDSQRQVEQLGAGWLNEITPESLAEEERQSVARATATATSTVQTTSKEYSAAQTAVEPARPEAMPPAYVRAPTTEELLAHTNLLDILEGDYASGRRGFPIQLKEVSLISKGLRFF